MNVRTSRATLLVLLTAAACSGAPSSKPAAQPVSPAPAAEPVPQSEALARADALLEDLKRREAAQAEYDRAHPAPVAAPLRMPLPAARSATRAPAPDPVTVSTPAAPAVAAPARDATWWKQQMRSLQSTLDAEAAKLAEAEKANFKYGYNDAQAEYKRRVAAVANARLAIERLHDDARRAGVPPGWLRLP